jgi:hypothetical protein
MALVEYHCVTPLQKNRFCKILKIYKNNLAEPWQDLMDATL